VSVKLSTIWTTIVYRGWTTTQITDEGEIWSWSPNQSLTMVSCWLYIAVHWCFVCTLWWVYSTVLPDVNCVISGCHDQSFELWPQIQNCLEYICSGRLSFVLVLFWWVIIFRTCNFNISGLLKQPQKQCKRLEYSTAWGACSYTSALWGRSFWELCAQATSLSWLCHYCTCM